MAKLDKSCIHEISKCVDSSTNTKDLVDIKFGIQFEDIENISKEKIKEMLLILVQEYSFSEL